MRLSTELQDSEVFNNFMKIAEQDNMMAKKPEYLYPDYDISQSSPELDLSLSVTAGEQHKLYHVHSETGEDLVNAAHPGGGTVTQLDVTPSDKLALVETIVEQHKVIEDIARGLATGKIASLSERLVRLADKFDEAGFEVMAEYLTSTLSDLNSIAKKKVVTADDSSLKERIRAGNYKAQQLINQAQILLVSCRNYKPEYSTKIRNFFIIRGLIFLS